MAEFILKDRNGKDRTFNKETIYVQGTDGELKSFTHGAGNPVVQPLNVTENGEYPVPDGVDGFAPVTVNVPDVPAVIRSLSIKENGTYAAPNGVDGYNPIVVEVPSEEPVLQDKEITENGSYSADAGFDGLGTVTVNIPDPTKTVLLAEQEFGGFVLDSNFGAYSPGYVTPAPFVLNNGETYYVKWDGTGYECTAIAFDYSGVTMVAIGNGSSLGLPGNGEPFLITYNAAYNNTQLFSTETTDSHTVGIWQDVVQEIKLQDKTIKENGEYTADSGFDGLGKVLVEVASSGGAAGIERVTIVPEQTATPTWDSSYGLYKYSFTPTEEIADYNTYAICFNGVWYICTQHFRGFAAGALTGQKIGAYGNHVIMTKFFNYSLTWNDNTAQPYSFFMCNQEWIATATADSFTFRIDKISITE